MNTTIKKFLLNSLLNMLYFIDLKHNNINIIFDEIEFANEKNTAHSSCSEQQAGFDAIGYRFTDPLVYLMSFKLAYLLKKIRLRYKGLLVKTDGFAIKKAINWRSTFPFFSGTYLSLLSSYCNCRCSFCYETNTVLPWSKVLLKNISLFEVLLKSYDPKTQKGFPIPRVFSLEPFINKNAIELIKVYRKYFPDTSLRFTTNGTKFTECELKELKKLLPIKFAVSLNTIHEDYRKQLMNIKGEDNALLFIRLLNKYKIPFSIAIVGWPLLPLSDIETTIKFTIRYKPDNIGISLPGYTKLMKCRKYSQEDFKKRWEDLKVLANQLRKEIPEIPIFLVPEAYEKDNIAAIVHGISNASPAWLQGIQRGDEIIKVNDRFIHSGNEFIGITDRQKIYSLELKRKGKIIKKKFTDEFLTHEFTQIYFNGNGKYPNSQGIYVYGDFNKSYIVKILKA